MVTATLDGDMASGSNPVTINETGGELDASQFAMTVIEGSNMLQTVVKK